MFKFYRPVKESKVNQWFGENKNPIYAKLGMKGHNGLDYSVYSGTPVYWSGDMSATVERILWDRLGGFTVDLIFQDGDKTYRYTNYHNQKAVVSVGQKVETGQLTHYSDNTGEATTGPHLHAMEIKEVVKDQYGNWNAINKDNGYLGAIDPTPFYIHNIFVGDLMTNLNTQVSLLTKVFNLLKQLIK